MFFFRSDDRPGLQAALGIFEGHPVVIATCQRRRWVLTTTGTLPVRGAVKKTPYRDGSY